MAKHFQAKGIRTRNIVSDMADLLDMAGVDNIDRAKLDELIHADHDMQAMLDFASTAHRRNGYRIEFADLVSEYFGGAK